MLGALLVFLLGVAALIGSCAYVVRQQVQVRQSASIGDFEREAARVMARFEGVPALIEDGPSGPTVSHKALTLRGKRGGSIANLKILAFSTREGKLVRLTLPIWLLRMAPDGRMDINSDEVGLDDVKLSIADVEMAGPGPVYVRARKDSHVLVWTE